jgi:Uma2 family endonuclease
MSIAATQLMEADEFLRWCLDQEARYELVDGVPVEMMAGASERHDVIVVNIIIALGIQLRGGPCRPTTDDVALRTRIRSVRRPDVMVTCDPPRGDVYEAVNPRLAVEVISKSNSGVSWERKLKEYRRHEKLEYILLVDSEVAAVTLFERTKTGWDILDLERFFDVVELPTIKCRLSLADIYANTGIDELPQATTPTTRDVPAA